MLCDRHVAGLRITEQIHIVVFVCESVDRVLFRRTHGDNLRAKLVCCLRILRDFSDNFVELTVGAKRK